MNTNMNPTSGLPFAARHCDLTYFESREGRRWAHVSSAPNEGLASNLAAFLDRFEQSCDLLAVIEDYLKLAHKRGNEKTSADVAFSRAMSMIGLVRELTEACVDDLDGAHEDYCAPATEVKP